MPPKHVLALRLASLLFLGLKLPFLFVIAEVEFIGIQHFLVEQIRRVATLSTVSHNGKGVEQFRFVFDVIHRLTRLGSQYRCKLTCCRPIIRLKRRLFYYLRVFVLGCLSFVGVTERNFIIILSSVLIPYNISLRGFFLLVLTRWWRRQSNRVKRSAYWTEHFEHLAQREQAQVFVIVHANHEQAAFV